MQIRPRRAGYAESYAWTRESRMELDSAARIAGSHMERLHIDRLAQSNHSEVT